MGSWAEPKKGEKRLSTESGVEISFLFFFYFFFCVCVCGKTNSKSSGIIIIVPWMRERETFSSCKKRRVCMWGSGPYNSARPRPPSRISKVYGQSGFPTHYIAIVARFFFVSFFFGHPVSLSLFTKSTQSPSITTFTHTQKGLDGSSLSDLSSSCWLDWIYTYNTKADRQELQDRFRSGKRIQIRRGKIRLLAGGGMAGIVMMMTRKKKR